MCSSSTHQIEYLRVTWVSSASLSDGSGKAFRLEVRTVRDVFFTDSSVFEALPSRSVREKLQSK